MVSIPTLKSATCLVLEKGIRFASQADWFNSIFIRIKIRKILIPASINEY